MAASPSPSVPPDDRRYTDERGQVGYRPSVLLAVGFTALVIAVVLVCMVVFRAAPPINWEMEGPYIEPRDFMFDSLSAVLAVAGGLCAVIGLATLGVGFYRFASLVEPSRRD